MYLCKTIEVRPISRDIVCFVLLPLDQRIRYSAGQYVFIDIPQSSFQLPFTIANAPSDDKRLIFYFRSKKDDPLLKKFKNSLRVGQVLSLSEAQGEAVLYDNNRPILFIAGGTGVTQSLALLEALEKSKSKRQCRLYWSIKQKEDFFLQEILVRFKEKWVNFDYQITLTDESVELWPYRQGYVYHLLVADRLNFSEYDIYLSGPIEMIRDAMGVLKKNSANLEHVYNDMGVR